MSTLMYLFNGPLNLPPIFLITFGFYSQLCLTDVHSIANVCGERGCEADLTTDVDVEAQKLSLLQVRRSRAAWGTDTILNSYAVVELSLYDDQRPTMLGGQWYSLYGPTWVSVELYYPTSPQFARRSVPLVVFMHGTYVPGDMYGYLGVTLAKAGYAFASVRTWEREVLLVTSESMAKDMAFTLDELRRKSQTDKDFPLYGRLAGAKAAAMGHSLGGAASFYAAVPGSSGLGGLNYSSSFSTVVSLAGCCQVGTLDVGFGLFDRCENSNWSLPTLRALEVPTLQLGGTADCICAPSTSQVPQYAHIGSACKYIVTYVGGSHCAFNSPLDDLLSMIENPAECAADKIPCSSNMVNVTSNTMPALTQRKFTVELVMAWFDWHLRGNSSAQSVINYVSEHEKDVEMTTSC